MDRSNERWEGKSGEAEDRGRTTATPSTPSLLFADALSDTDGRCSSNV
jgi:hypothetical protein